MVKQTTARFLTENRDSDVRYIHKYYLPQDLRNHIFPADIQGIRRCFHDECELWEERIPEKLPDCVITYSDIGMEKRIDGDTARQIMAASWAYYYDDCRAELTHEEEQAAQNLNHWLIEWEKELLARCIQISETMERQVRSGDRWLTNFEMDVTVYFYVRDDDPFSDENMPDSWQNEIECDSQLLCETNMICRGPISAEKAAREDYWGIGDSVDHNDFSSHYDDNERPERHCLTFHELYDHLYFPRKHMRRIGYVSTDIVVRHQNGISVDLNGELVVAVRDEARIREDFEFYEDLA